MVTTLKDINGIPNGAKFSRCDLHIHTPSSYDYDGTPSIDEIIDKAIDEGLDVIGITDHNTIGEIDILIKKALDKGLIVFPGVEFSVNCVSKIIHVVALFDPSTSKEKIQYIISNTGIKPEEQGKEGAYTEKTMNDILTLIDENDGIAIAAHVDKSKGLWVEAEHRTRIELCNNKLISAFEVYDTDTFSIPNSLDYRDVPIIQSSDAHSLNEIGTKITRLKLENYTIEGLKQVFVDKKSRIKLESSEYVNYPQIVGMSVDGGFIDGIKYHYNPNLNCYIGGRGTGKSTSIELLRYCLDSLPDLEPYKKRRLDMIDQVLENGIINLYIKTSENIIYNVRRKYGEKPLCFNESGTLVDLNIKDIFPLTIYGERELNDVSYDVKAQLKLIDGFVSDLDSVLRKEKEIIDDLDRNSDEIISLEDKIFNLEEDLTELNAINEIINNLKKYEFDDKLEDKKKIEEEKNIIKRVLESLSEIKTTVSSENRYDYLEKIYDQSFKDMNYEDYPNGKILKSINYHYDRLVKYMKKNHDENVSYIEGVQTNIINNNEKLILSHIKKEEEILKIMEELESDEISDAAQKWSDMQSKKVGLKGKQKDMELAKNKLVNLKENRIIKIDELKRLRNQIYNKRDDVTKKLNDQLGSEIDISIVKNGDNEEFLEELNKLTSGSGSRKTDKEKITKKISPYELFEYIESQDYDAFSLKCGISENASEKILNFSSIKSNKYKIQQVMIPDLPLIKLQVGKEKKGIETLSLGQRCTTLLSLILMESKAPLVLDTPEEGLDNIYVFDTLVKTLKEIKEKRQIIIATHNANIPVSGDSELIFCLKSDATNGEIKCYGSVETQTMKDTIQEVLEGGKEAFKIRMKRYGY